MKFIKFFKPILIRLKPLHLMKLAGRRMFALPLGAAAIQLTGTKLHDNLKDPLTQFKTLKEAVKYFKLPGIGIISDLSVEPEACGCPIKFRDNEFPLIFPRYEELNDNDIESLPIPQPQKSARMPVILEVVRHLSRSLGVIIGAGGIGPLTLAGEILGTENVFKMTLEGKEKLHKVIRYCSKVVEIYNKALIDAGADTIIIGEPTASGLSQKTFWEFSGSYLKNIIKNLKRHVTLHICGRTGHLIEEMWLTGCSGISIDSPVDILDALKKTPRDKIVVGNIDPVEVLLKGTPLLVREKTLEILNKTMGFKNYILSTGCDIEPKTPILNIETLIKTVREWR